MGKNLATPFLENSEKTLTDKAASDILASYHPQSKDNKAMERDKLETARKFSVGIKRMLKIRGMSQKDLAQAAGLGEATISRACRANTTTNIDIVIRIARALDSPIDNLFLDLS